MQIVLVLMIIGAVVAMEMKNLFSSVIALAACGIGLIIACLFLRAPGLAATQLAAVILSLIILLPVTLRPHASHDRIPLKWGYWAFAAVFVVSFLWFGARALAQLPPFGNPVMKMGSQYVAEVLRRPSATNVVAAIILDFRSYDTLGAAVILFTSIIGTLAVMRTVGSKR